MNWIGKQKYIDITVTALYSKVHDNLKLRADTFTSERCVRMGHEIMQHAAAV